MTHCIDDDSSMHINQQSISAFSALSVRENKVGSVKSEVGSEVGSMTERHCIQRRSVFPMRDSELKTPLRPLRPLRETIFKKQPILEKSKNQYILSWVKMHIR